MLVTKSTEAPALGDADLFHQSAGLDLADARERLEHSDYLRLAHDWITGHEAKNLRKGNRAHLELLFEFCPHPASFCCLCECCLALVIGKYWRCCHAGHCSEGR